MTAIISKRALSTLRASIVASALATVLAFVSAHGQASNPQRSAFRFGVAASALQYDGGRSEQAFGGAIRWVPVRGFSLSANPTFVRQSVTATTAGVSTARTGLTDIPVTATVSHAFRGAYTPLVLGALGMTLPVGDTASGLGAGQASYSGSIGVGISPSEATWAQVGLGRALSGTSIRSAFGAGSSWLDLGGGLSLTDQLSVDAGYSTDVGAIDAAYGRSSSVTAGVELEPKHGMSINLAASHGISGVAPTWSFSLGVGTAFPSLGHAASAMSTNVLSQNFGGGTHGLVTSGSGKGGKGRKG
jgi:hypothetical protein